MVAALEDTPEKCELAIEQNSQDALGNAQAKLEHLELSQIRLEGIAELQRSPEIMEVHQSMDKGINPSAEKGGAVAESEMKKRTPDSTNGQVVVNMKEGKLLILLPEDHKKGIKHIEILRHIVDKNPKLNGCVKLTIEIKKVVKQVRCQADGHRQRCDDLGKIVHQHRRLALEWLPVLHQSANSENNYEIRHMARNDDGKLNQKAKLGMKAHPRPAVITCRSIDRHPECNGISYSGL